MDAAQERTPILKGFSVPRSRSIPGALSGTTELKMLLVLAMGCTQVYPSKSGPDEANVSKDSGGLMACSG